MKAMDNTQIMEKIEKISFQLYLEKLIDAKMLKVILFSRFPHTAAPNLSDPHYFALISDLSKIVELNSGCFAN
jgi:hypothetical protein